MQTLRNKNRPSMIQLQYDYNNSTTTVQEHAYSYRTALFILLPYPHRSRLVQTKTRRSQPYLIMVMHEEALWLPHVCNRADTFKDRTRHRPAHRATWSWKEVEFSALGRHSNPPAQRVFHKLRAPVYPSTLPSSFFYFYYLNYSPHQNQ